MSGPSGDRPRRPADNVIEFPLPASLVEDKVFVWPEMISMAQCVARHRACTSGSVVETMALYAPHPSFRAVISDGSAKLALVFLGRDRVPGIVEGAVVQVEGMVGLNAGQLSILNPRYRFL